MSYKFNPFTGNFDEVSGPGGSDDNLQYNNGGVFGGASKLHWDDSGEQLNIGVDTPTHGISVGRLNIEDTYTNAGATQMVSFGYGKATSDGAYSYAGLNSSMAAFVASGITNSSAAYGAIIQSLRNTSLGGTGDSGSIASIIGMNFNYGHSNGFAVSPTTTNVYGLFFDPKMQTGTITNFYDIYIDVPSTGATVTNRWSFYQSDTTTRNYFGSKVGIGTNDPQTLLDVSKSTGATLTLSRNDTSVTTSDMIGKIQFWNNESDLTTQNIYADIEVQADRAITSDAAQGRMIFRTTQGAAGGSPVEAMRITGGGDVLIVAPLNTSTSAVNTQATQTLANKRITPRVTSVTSSATPTINTDICDDVTITALATNITSMTTNLSGTPNNFDRLTIRFKDDGTARSITWGSSFSPYGVALPTTTVISKVLTVGFIYDSVAAIWGCVASVEQ